MKTEIRNIPYLSPYITETRSFVSNKYSQNRKHHFQLPVHKDDDIHDNNVKAVTAEKDGKTWEPIFEIFIADGKGEDGNPNNACFKNFAAC